MLGRFPFVPLPSASFAVRPSMRIDGRLGSGDGAMVDLRESTALRGTALISGINPAKMGPQRPHAIALETDAFLGPLETLGDGIEKH
jgi:hypothetical protein